MRRELDIGTGNDHRGRSSSGRYRGMNFALGFGMMENWTNTSDEFTTWLKTGLVVYSTSLFELDILQISFDERSSEMQI